MIKGFLDLMTIYLLTGFSSRPLHLIGVGGMLFFAAGGVGIVSLSGWWVISRAVESFDPIHLHEKAIFYYCILALLLGAQFLLAGLLAELVVARTHGPRDIQRWRHFPAHPKGQARPLLNPGSKADE